MIIKMAAAAVLVCVLLVSPSAAVSHPYHWYSVYQKQQHLDKARIQQGTDVQQPTSDCPVSGASLVCQSARFTHPVNKNHTHIHVCPVDGKCMSNFASIYYRPAI